MLRDFIMAHREEILARARLRVAARDLPGTAVAVVTSGLSNFLDQLCEALRKATALESSDHGDIALTAGDHGQELFRQGLSVGQVVHDYGDICQVITGVVVEKRLAIPASEFQTLNLCLDDAIAGAVTAFAGHREQEISDEGTERLGMLAHEMRNLLNAAIVSFASIKKGVVAPGGSTGAIHERSLLGLQTLIDRSLADVRLDAGMQNLERIPVWEVLQGVEVGSALVAETKGLSFTVAPIDHTVVVLADRQILVAAVANLVQNAFKFTRPHTSVVLRASTTDTRILIDVEDQCGGLGPAAATDLLKPFVQAGSDRSGLGLGLAICKKAMKSIGGELRIRDLPGKGCIFTIDLPKQPPSPTSIHARDGKSKPGAGGPSGGFARAV